MSKVKIVLLGVLGIFLALQFFRGDLPEVNEVTQDDIMGQLQVDKEMSNLIVSACYDCHSNQTEYPWYSYVAPVSWLIIKDTNEGREELNFSKWGTMAKRRKIRKLKEIGEEVEEKEMPMTVFTITHPEARLTDEQRDQIVRWTKSMTQKLLKE
ncbi:MAG: heme-binding domain-containing protein [Cyclobacteriaceae bacterium]